MRVSAYIDGENHYLRSREACKLIHGDMITPQNAREASRVSGASAFPDEVAPILEAREDLFYFWDKHVFDHIHRKYRRRISGTTYSVSEGVYATSVVGDIDKTHKARVWIRSRGFDALIRHEPAKTRDSRLAQGGKPKTVDVALAVRILEDAYQGVYDACYVFTSDVDFIPAIEAVRRLGKQVYVCGYKNGIGKRSELEFIPTEFVDLTERVRTYVKGS